MKAIITLFAGILAAGYAHAEFRTWTRTDGKTAEMELISVKETGGDAVAEFKTRNGRQVSLPAAGFSDADANLIKEWKPAEAGTAAASGGMAGFFDDALDGNLVVLKGEKLVAKKDFVKPTKYYLFYYTASWCPPCQKFTPALVSFYNEKKPGNAEFEIILITSDEDEDAMEKYAAEKKMAWPQLKLSKAERFKKKFKHPGRGIPNLVLTDTAGKILKTSYEGENYLGPAVVMNHLGSLLKK